MSEAILSLIADLYQQIVQLKADLAAFATDLQQRVLADQERIASLEQELAAARSVPQDQPVPDSESAPA